MSLSTIFQSCCDIMSGHHQRNRWPFIVCFNAISLPNTTNSHIILTDSGATSFALLPNAEYQKKQQLNIYKGF